VFGLNVMVGSFGVEAVMVLTPGGASPTPTRDDGLGAEVIYVVAASVSGTASGVGAGAGSREKRPARSRCLRVRMRSLSWAAFSNSNFLAASRIWVSS
jgi:hypothetical protein